MGVQIKCCTYDDDPRIINKKPILVKTLICRITDPTDMINPVILINNVDGLEKCNYFVIGFRKYFKVGERKTNSRRLRLFLHEDVLSTWMPRIYVVGIISNASNVISGEIQQNFLLEAKKRVSRVKINNSYGELSKDPVVIVQSPQASVQKPLTPI